MARAGPSKQARNPSPVVLISLPRKRKSAVEGGFRSHVPLQIELAKAVVVDEVERSLADDLVGYLGFANRHISRLRRVHSKKPRGRPLPRRQHTPLDTTAALPSQVIDRRPTFA